MNLRKQWLPITISLLVTGFLLLSLFNLKYRTKEVVGQVIAQDVVTLQKIFERIDADCTIISFDLQKNPINFLNVKSFVGSEVGPMNLTHPAKWQGPYLADHPTVEGKEYQIVHTRKGYFITPGEGVKLPNGKVVGEDILFDEDADIMRMMYDENALYFEERPLAVKLNLGAKVNPLVLGMEEYTE